MSADYAPVKIMFIGAIIFFLLLGFTLAVVARPAAGGRSRGMWVGVLAVPIVLIVLGALFMTRQAVVVTTPTAQYSGQQTYPLPGPDVQVEAVEQSTSGSTLSADGWQTLLRDPSVVRDPHTSMDSLKAFLAERVAVECEKVGPGDSPRRVFGGDRVPQDLTAFLTSELHANTTEAPVFQRSPDQTSVTLQWESRSERRMTWWPQPMLRGTLVARIEGPKGSSTVSAKLDEKPWVNSTGVTVGRSEYVVIHSPRPAQSSEEARWLLHTEATSALTVAAEGEVRATVGGSRVPAQVIRAQAENLLARNAGVLDEVIIRMDRPFVGPVWYAAMLLDTTGSTRVPIAVASIETTDHRRQSWAAGLLGLGGMVVVLGAVYMVLNALTRGYFRNQLRAVAVVGVVVAAAVIFLLLLG